MTTFYRKETILLSLGDLVFFSLALWLALFFRYNEIPTNDFFLRHLYPFLILFVIWIAVFFIVGLYDKNILLFRKKFPELLLNAFIINAVTAVIFFYFVPSFDINPKTNLAIYLAISFFIIFGWRMVVANIFSSRSLGRLLLVGSGEELRELEKGLKITAQNNFKVYAVLDTASFAGSLHEHISEKIEKEDITAVIADLRNEAIITLLPRLNGVRVIDFYEVYEEVFERIPLALLSRSWFIEKISYSGHVGYDTLKRAMDVVLSLFLLAFLMVVFPLVWLCIKLEDGGDIFISQERIGENNGHIFVYKFRTMNTNDQGAWHGETKNEVTKIGRFLRQTSLDEFPQLWNVLKGEMSLIGPRNDIIGIASRLDEVIPHHALRYMIKPGITGWAQTHQAYAPGHINPQSIEETKTRFSYDIYYLKNRSFMLDIRIAFLTAKTLLSRRGK